MSSHLLTLQSEWGLITETHKCDGKYKEEENEGEEEWDSAVNGFMCLVLIPAGFTST